MLSWKEKVAEKLSRLLGDAPSSPSHTAMDSPIAGSEHQAIPFCTEESSSPKKSSFSSFFLPFLRTTSSGVNVHESNTPSHPHAIRPLPLRSHPRRWKANGFKWKDRPLDKSAESETGSESEDTIEISKENLGHVSERNINGHGSHGIGESSISHDSAVFLSYLTEKSTFISSNLYEFLHSSLPNIVKGCHWVLLYSTLKHGISLRTLLRRSDSLPGPCLLIVGDMQGAVFGGLLDSPPKPTSKRKYQGTNQTFVFTTIYGEPRLFRATGANRYYYLCLNDVLAFGGGGNFALCLDEDLLHGTSGPCETFGNLCLAHSSEFDLKNVEEATYRARRADEDDLSAARFTSMIRLLRTMKHTIDESVDVHREGLRWNKS